MDDVLLMLVHPIRQGDEEERERGHHRAHGRRLSRHCASDFSNDFDPFEFLHVTGAWHSNLFWTVRERLAIGLGLHEFEDDIDKLFEIDELFFHDGI